MLLSLRFTNTSRIIYYRSSLLQLDGHPLAVGEHGSFDLEHFLDNSVRSVAKGPIVGLLALTQPVLAGLGDFELGRAELGSDGRFVVRSVHHQVMALAVAERLSLARSTRAPFVHAVRLEFDLKR